MPDQEAAIPYKHPLLSASRGLAIVTFPFWGVYAPFQILLSFQFDIEFECYR